MWDLERRTWNDLSHLERMSHLERRTWNDVALGTMSHLERRTWNAVVFSLTGYPFGEKM